MKPIGRKIMRLFSYHPNWEFGINAGHTRPKTWRKVLGSDRFGYQIIWGGPMLTFFEKFGLHFSTLFPCLRVCIGGVYLNAVRFRITARSEFHRITGKVIGHDRAIVTTGAKRAIVFHFWIRNICLIAGYQEG